MKKILIALTIIVMLLSVNMTAFAQVNVTLTYTADNEFTGFWYHLSGTAIPLALGLNSADWRYADSYTALLGYGPTHEFIWGIQNWERPSSGNPGGFLAEISPAAALYPPSSSALTDVSWDVFVDYGSSVGPSDFGTLPWTSATEYGANNDLTTIWNINFGAVAGIDGAAQWIWGPDNFDVGDPPGGNDMVYVKANVHVVPEPGTMLLLGSGLLGLGIFARFRRKKR